MPAIPASPAQLSPSTASHVKAAYSDWFRAIGAIDGGKPTGNHTLELRFPSHAQAIGASTALEANFDGVELIIREQNGGKPQGTASPGDVISLIESIPGVVRSQLRRIPAPGFVVTSATPDTNAHLDPILKDTIFGVPVRWETGR